MKSVSRAFALALMLSSLTWASIDGTVINRTTGKPAPGVPMTLVKPGQKGMQTIGTTTSDASGHFVFAKDQPGGGPQLLQATFNGVNYNKLMTPNVPTSNVEVEVFEVSKSPAIVRVAERMMVIEPSISQISVSETVIVQNESKTTYNNDELGGLRFFLPPAANGQSRVQVQGPQGMPLPRAAEKTKDRDVMQVNFPIKPGQTEFDVTYSLPAGSPFTYRGQLVGVTGMPTTPLRMIAPSGVTLAGKELEKVGTEPKTQATIYTVVAPAGGAFSAEITGTGSLHPEGSDAAAGDDSESPQVTEGPPQIYHHLGWLVGLALAALGVGLVVLFRSSPVRSPYGK
jgi:hypothetical protein